MFIRHDKFVRLAKVGGCFGAITVSGMNVHQSLKARQALMKVLISLCPQPSTRALAGAIATLLIAQVTQAATIHWDGDATAATTNVVTSANLGGTANWNHSLSGNPLANWWNSSSASDQAWVNDRNDLASAEPKGGVSVDLRRWCPNLAPLGFSLSVRSAGGTVDVVRRKAKIFLG
jgi:hypothetical protein